MGSTRTDARDAAMRTKSDLVAAGQRENAVKQALLDYECEQISLGRLAELLDTDYQTALEFVLSQGIEPRFGPLTVEEAWRDIETLRKLSKRPSNSRV
jgi:predicted HTH domain antitoxin